MTTWRGSCRDEPSVSAEARESRLGRARHARFRPAAGAARPHRCRRDRRGDARQCLSSPTWCCAPPPSGRARRWTGWRAIPAMRRVVFSENLSAPTRPAMSSSSAPPPTATTVLLVGHNPMMEDVATALSGDGDPNARNVLMAGFPTSALAVIRFPAGCRRPRRAKAISRPSSRRPISRPRRR